MVKFSELPSFLRVRLDGEKEEEFWHRIEEFGGVRSFSRTFDYSESKLYNWKNSEVFLPIDLVRQVMGSEATEGVRAYKGRGRSKPVENPVFPLPESDELLTRVDTSVHVDSRGVPVYQVNDRGLVERFAELLQEYGNTPYSIYSRSMLELRYPKYLHGILSGMSYSQDFAALVDEEGFVEDSILVHGGRKVSVEEFDGRLYSRDKALQLALERNDSEKVREIVSGEAERVRRALSG